jgi:hypothetical protein
MRWRPDMVSVVEEAKNEPNEEIPFFPLYWLFRT